MGEIRKIFLIGNPISGGGAEKKILKAVSLIEEEGFKVELMVTEKKGDAESFARQISLEYSAYNPKPLVIAAGGDGTYNEVANGLIYTNIPMAILPMGTTSVLAKELKIPRDLRKAVHIAIKGIIKEVHLGRITLLNQDKKNNFKNLKDNNLIVNDDKSESFVSRCFLLMAGIGFDGEAVYRVNQRIKRFFGKGAYILSGLGVLFHYNPSPVKIVSFIDSNGVESREFLGYTTIIGKAACYGGDLKVTPDAKLTDPYLYVFTTHSPRRFSLLKCVFGILIGKHTKFKEISYFKALDIYIKGKAHIQIDGDYFGMTPAKIDVIENGLRLVFPV